MKHIFFWCTQCKEFAYRKSAALFFKVTLISLFTTTYSPSIVFSQDFSLSVTARFPLHCSRFRACYWLGATETSTLPDQVLSAYPSSSLSFTYTYKQLTGPRGWTGTVQPYIPELCYWRIWSGSLLRRFSDIKTQQHFFPAWLYWTIQDMICNTTVQVEVLF